MLDQPVIPAQAGIQGKKWYGVPAFAGTTGTMGT